MSSPISYFKFVLAYCILPSKIICRVRSVHETGELTVWRSRCLMLPHKVWQRQIPSSCAVRQVIETVNSSKLSCEKTARKWMRGNNNFCYIARLSLNKMSTMIGWFMVTCLWSNSNVSRPGYNCAVVSRTPSLFVFAVWLFKGKSNYITKHLMYGPSGN